MHALRTRRSQDERAPTLLHTLPRRGKLSPREDRELRARLVASRREVGARKHCKSKDAIPVVEITDADAVLTVIRAFSGYLWSYVNRNQGTRPDEAYSVALLALTRTMQKVDDRPHSSIATVLRAELMGAFTNEIPYARLIKLPSGAMTTRVVRKLGVARQACGVDTKSPLSHEQAHAVARYLYELPGENGEPFAANVSYDTAHALVLLADAMQRGFISLDAPIQTVPTLAEGVDLFRELVDSAPNPEELLGMKEEAGHARTTVLHALDALDARERRIVEARKLTETPLRLKDLAVELGITSERVRQLEAQALQKMKQAITIRAMADNAK